MTTEWLIDKSAFARLGVTPDADDWINRINRGLVRVSTVTLLELGYSARSGADWRRGLQGPLVASLPVQHLTPAIEDRAFEVQGLLAERGHHRAAKIPDLLVAAAAERSGLTVLHVGKDFELIAAVSGQPVERLRGDF